jgi:hypothetical protein
MPNSQVLREHTNGRLDFTWKSLDCEHQLVLSWFNSSSLGRAVAEIQVVMDTLPEFGERPVFGILDNSRLLREFAFTDHKIS